MRKTLFIALLFAAQLHAAGPAPSFVGNWSLDKNQSKDLPPFYASVKTHSLTIAQKAKQLSVGVDITSDAHEPEHFDFTYIIDGGPSHTETKVRTPNGPMMVPSTLQATAETNGDLTITIERALPTRDGGSMKGTTVEKWRLQPDGKTLIIERSDEMPRGTFTSTLVFTRS